MKFSFKNIDIQKHNPDAIPPTNVIGYHENRTIFFFIFTNKMDLFEMTVDFPFRIIHFEIGVIKKMMFGFDDHLIVYVYNNYLLKLKPDGKKKSIFPFLDSSLLRKLADTFGMTWFFYVFDGAREHT
jgi:hypothetical protein